jgi:hypothetical protein
LPPEFVKAILPTNLTVALDAEEQQEVGASSETFTTKMFLASTTEAGLANENGVAEGARLELFANAAKRTRIPSFRCVQIAIINGYSNANFAPDRGWHWLLRTPHVGSDCSVRVVGNSGVLTHGFANQGFYGVCPLCNLTNELMVSDNVNSNGHYEPVYTLPPTISGTDGDLGEKSSGFAYDYTVDHPHGKETGVQEILNDAVVKEYTATLGAQAQMIVDNENWTKLAQGSHTMQIRARNYSTYGVSIDLSNDDPATAVTYTDDAASMIPGAAWNAKPIFENIKPCVLKNGVVQYYLNPDNYAQKADGTAAVITGADGDVMIEIPKTGYQINTDGDILTVKITDEPNKPGFRYYAHTRDTEGDCDKLYVSAYKGSLSNSRLRSVSGAELLVNTAISSFRGYAREVGAWYDLLSFYPVTLLQCLFLIRFKNRNSQAALGRGYVDNNADRANTGGADAKGMFFGETTGKQQIKCFGIEDLWGNAFDWVDGVCTDENRNILTAFKDFNNTGAGYTNHGQGATENFSSYMIKPQGTTEKGFIIKEGGGDGLTHFADHAGISASRFGVFGGYSLNSSLAGIFSSHVAYDDESRSWVGGRLMYLQPGGAAEKTPMSGNVAARTLSFAKNTTTLSAKLKTPVKAEFMPTRIKIEVAAQIPSGAIFKVETCNNGNDPDPVWEDITNATLKRHAHVFANKTKTAAEWGVNVRVSIDRNGATGNCYLAWIKGNFAPGGNPGGIGEWVLTYDTTTDNLIYDTETNYLICHQGGA